MKTVAAADIVEVHFLVRRHLYILQDTTAQQRGGTDAGFQQNRGGNKRPCGNGKGRARGSSSSRSTSSMMKSVADIVEVETLVQRHPLQGTMLFQHIVVSLCGVGARGQSQLGCVGS
jgi:hypothetical protein